MVELAACCAREMRCLLLLLSLTHCLHCWLSGPLVPQDNFQVRMEREKELQAKLAAKKAAKAAAGK